MKKLLKLTFVVLTIICIALSGKVYATSLDCNMEIQTPKTTYSKNEEFIANVYISNINSDKGVIALQATLEYNKNDLTILEMNGKNGWDTPVEDVSYNPANGKLVLTRNALGKNNEVVFEIKFKVNSNSASASAINLKDIAITNGDDAKDISIVRKDLTLGTSDNGNQGGNSGDNQGGNSGNQGGNSGNNQGGNNGNQGGNSGNNQGGNNGNQGGNSGNNQGGNNGNQGGNSGNNQGGNNNNQSNNNNNNQNTNNGNGTTGTNGNNSGNGSSGSTGSTSQNQVDNQSKNNIPKTGVAKHPVLFVLVIIAIGTCSYFYVNMKYAYSKPYGKPFTK